MSYNNLKIDYTKLKANEYIKLFEEMYSEDYTTLNDAIDSIMGRILLENMPSTMDITKETVVDIIHYVRSAQNVLSNLRDMTTHISDKVAVISSFPKYATEVKKERDILVSIRNSDYIKTMERYLMRPDRTNGEEEILSYLRDHKEEFKNKFNLDVGIYIDNKIFIDEAGNEHYDAYFELPDLNLTYTYGNFDMDYDIENRSPEHYMRAAYGAAVELYKKYFPVSESLDNMLDLFKAALRLESEMLNDVSAFFKENLEEISKRAKEM